MMVPSVTVKLTLTSFLNSGSLYLSTREMMDQKSIYEFSLNVLNLILWMHNLQGYSEIIHNAIVELLWFP